MQNFWLMDPRISLCQFVTCDAQRAETHFWARRYQSYARVHAFDGSIAIQFFRREENSENFSTSRDQATSGRTRGRSFIICRLLNDHTYGYAATQSRLREELC
jgi:hypothetical protein